MPLYVRAGTILPLGPVKQHTGEKVVQPLSIAIYPGADDSFLLYEDDGRSFRYRRGEWMGAELQWADSRRVLTLRLASGCRMLPPSPRRIEVKLDSAVQTLDFDGRPVELSF
jgi:hypothetical protein